MIRRAIVIIVTFSLLFSMAALKPQQAEAKTLAEINREIKAIQDRIKRAEEEQRKANANKRYYKQRQINATKEMEALISQIDKISGKIDNVQSQIETTQSKLLLTGELLEQAEQRVGDRDELFRDRLVLMYTQGYVSYLDVLFESKSFDDFLNRFNAIKSMVDNDREILDQHIADKEIIVKQKQQIEAQLASVNQIYSSLATAQSELNEQEQRKEELIEDYEDKAEESEEVSEEQEQLLISLARKAAELQEEKRKIENQPKTEYEGGKLSRPIASQYRITSSFGYRKHPITGKWKLHKGIDFGAPKGTTIKAAADGVVILAGWQNGYGNIVIINHGTGMWTAYAHIRRGGIKVSVGQSVKRGQKIAEVGSTGRSTGNHLHFEVRINEQAKNPLNYL